MCVRVCRYVDIPTVKTPPQPTIVTHIATATDSTPSGPMPVARNLTWPMEESCKNENRKEKKKMLYRTCDVKRITSVEMLFTGLSSHNRFRATFFLPCLILLEIHYFWEINYSLNCLHTCTRMSTQSNLFLALLVCFWCAAGAHDGYSERFAIYLPESRYIRYILAT